MRYARHCCTRRKTPEGDVYTGKCQRCKISVKVTTSSGAMEKWERGAFIQEVCADIDSNAREFLISGTCPKCWGEMFPEPETINKARNLGTPEVKDMTPDE